MTVFFFSLALCHWASQQDRVEDPVSKMTVVAKHKVGTVARFDLFRPNFLRAEVICSSGYSLYFKAALITTLL